MRTPSRNPRGVKQFHRHVKVILLTGAKCLFLDGERVIASALPIAGRPIVVRPCPVTGRPVTGRSALSAGRTNTPARQLHPERIAMDREDASGLGEIPSDPLEHA